MKGADIIDLASQRALRAVAKNTPRSVELIYSLSSLVELVKVLKADWGLGYNEFKDTTFAHVLNTGLEDLWPGDIEMFYPELFACRLSGVMLFVDTSYMAEHKRCETQRRCQPYPEPIAYFDYDFFRALQGSFPCDAAVMARELEDVDSTDWVLDSPPQGRER